MTLEVEIGKWYYVERAYGVNKALCVATTDKKCGVFEVHHDDLPDYKPLQKCLPLDAVLPEHVPQPKPKKEKKKSPSPYDSAITFLSGMLFGMIVVTVPLIALVVFVAKYR